MRTRQPRYRCLSIFRPGVVRLDLLLRLIACNARDATAENGRRKWIKLKKEKGKNCATVFGNGSAKVTIAFRRMSKCSWRNWSTGSFLIQAPNSKIRENERENERGVFIKYAVRRVSAIRLRVDANDSNLDLSFACLTHSRLTFSWTSVEI